MNVTTSGRSGEIVVDKVNLTEKLALFHDHWTPKVVGELNGQHVKLVKFRGEFVWHHHDEDELFLVVKGRFVMEFRDRQARLEEGEFLIVPRSIEHRPVAEEEVHVLLFEPAGTLNTGDVQDERTVPDPERIRGRIMTFEVSRIRGEIGQAAPRRRTSLLGLGLLLLIFSPTISAAMAGPPRSRTFELTYRATVQEIPEGAKALDLWLPLPQTDRNQTIHRVTVDAPGPVTIGRKARFGNQCLHVRSKSPDGPLTVRLTIEATRIEDAGTDESLSDEDRTRYLAAEPLVPLDGPVRALAVEATRGLTTDDAKARAVYEKVVGMMKYDKTGTGWGRGDALFACDAKRGNCTDFHALIMGMCRSVGIPARFAIGLPLPATRGRGEIPGYHCWAELYVKGRGWVPIDGSEAAKHPEKRDYFFGHHDEDRLEFSRGRHLILVPAQQGDTLNFFVYPYAEVDGKLHQAIEHKLAFKDLERPSTGPEAGR